MKLEEPWKILRICQIDVNWQKGNQNGESEMANQCLGYCPQ